jgi:hypothetical protein
LRMNSTTRGKRPSLLFASSTAISLHELMHSEGTNFAFFCRLYGAVSRGVCNEQYCFPEPVCLFVSQRNCWFLNNLGIDNTNAERKKNSQVQNGSGNGTQ